MKDIELLAPAGGMEALRMAVISGADAVYIGGERFSARSGAENFSSADMKECIDFCHMYGVDVHVAVNTVIKEHEFDELAEYAVFLSDVGADAVIVQDHGAAEVFKQVAPELSLHASTQMTVTSLSGVKQLEEMGFSRVVLARELSRKSIEHICKNAKAEIEVFAHGALCMCYSGQCLMSSIIGGRSGNRGRCAQPCRLPYSTDGKKPGYILSPKDLSLIDELDTLCRIGVSSLKIEGRLKRPGYVGAVTSVFRRALDMGYAGKRDMDELMNAFNRGGFTKGYFTENTGASMMSGKKPGNAADGIYSEDVLKMMKGEKKRTVPIKISANLGIGKPLIVKITDYNGNSVTASSEECAEYAVNKPVTEEALKTRLTKTGATCYECTDTEIRTDGVSILGAAVINEVRRRAIDELTKKRIARKERKTAEYIPVAHFGGQTKTELTVEVQTAHQAEVAAELGIRRIYVSHDELKKINRHEGVVYAEKLTPVPEEQRTAVSDSVLVSNTGTWYDNKGKRLFGDYRLNITNSHSVRVVSEMESVCISPELNLKEIKALADKKSTAIEVIGYGRLTLMTMKNCPMRAAGNCRKNGGNGIITDRLGQEFLIRCGEGCVAELLNSKPVYMADKVKDITDAGVDFIRLVFTDETPDRCREIINGYKKALGGEKADKPEDNTFTRGHFYRGVM